MHALFKLSCMMKLEFYLNFITMRARLIIKLVIALGWVLAIAYYVD
jgi:hypothetical protein